MNPKKLHPSESELRRSATEWLSILSAAGKKAPDVVPDGFKTVQQIARETNRGESNTRRLMKDALKAGLVEECKFSIATGNKLYPTPHYRILPCNSPKRSA